MNVIELMRLSGKHSFFGLFCNIVIALPYQETKVHLYRVFIWNCRAMYLLFWLLLLFKQYFCHPLFREFEQGPPRQRSLGWHILFIKWELDLCFMELCYRWPFCPQKSVFFSFIFRSLAEFSRIPVVVTNQVRSQSRDEICQYYFQGMISKISL